MKKTVCYLLVLLFVSVMIFPFGTDHFDEELRKSFDFFWEQANNIPGSKGYGLIRDRYPGSPECASIASTGFGLSAIVIGTEKKWITYEQAAQRAEGTLDTLLKMETVRGFFYHFIDINTAQRLNKSEISTIDTAILLCGALTCGRYFGGEIFSKAMKLYSEVNWKIFVDKSTNYFYMSLMPESGFSGRWDFYAEQLMMYVLGAASPTYPIGKEVYYAFKRNRSSYKGNTFIHSWFGSLFTHQFSHAWIDFRNKKDAMGIDWYQNSVDASLANYEYCQDLKSKYPHFSESCWGLSACDSINGYNGLYGSQPSGYDNKVNVVDGTIAVSAALGSVVFTPEESLKALEYYYSIDGLWGRYGLKNAFNPSQNWIAKDYIGIDKGITLLMFSNYENGLIWSLFSELDCIKEGLKKLEIN
jgi:hypothetical protein